jgi:hypothetical protein
LSPGGLVASLLSARRLYLFAMFAFSSTVGGDWAGRGFADNPLGKLIIEKSSCSLDFQLPPFQLSVSWLYSNNNLTRSNFRDSDSSLRGLLAKSFYGLCASSQLLLLSSGSGDVEIAIGPP